MIFRRPKPSYSITLKRAHSLLKIPRDSKTSISGEVNDRIVPSRGRIQEAFRAAAKRHHPDIVAVQTITKAKNNTNATFRECYEARELLLDYYVRRKFVPPEIVESTKNNPPPADNDESLFSVWTTSRSFQVEIFLRLSVCLGLAVGTFYHDLHLPEKRKQQIQRRDAQYYQFGPRPSF